jgi:hypothetical protein
VFSSVSLHSIIIVPPQCAGALGVHVSKEHTVCCCFLRLVLNNKHGTKQPLRKPTNSLLYQTFINDETREMK